MRTSHRSTVSALRAASFIALSALASIGAAAATRGSTDIYASNEIAASFGAGAKQSASPLGTGNYSGSTDTWGVNSFHASFGPADSIVPATSVCHSGSTEMYGVNGFVAFFGRQTSQTVFDLAQACSVGVTALR
jgi:hypothetical protein